jgi:hypothetical protein
MPSTSAIAYAFVALVAMGGAASAHAANAAAAAAAAADVAASEPKTLKERLGVKASDDQRVDNCKVPVAERGSKLRPDDCLHRRSAAN